MKSTLCLGPITRLRSTHCVDRTRSPFNLPPVRTLQEAILDKMRAAGESLSGLLITCDQVVVHEERILEKPGSVDEAHEFIEGYGRR
jgi:predicted house-cleaning NTP pyrophosphatase (Maf/HAM1 superfamily)